MTLHDQPPLALEVSGVSHAFARRLALDAVSLSVPVGRFAVLLGPNGAGKTTLFSLITRLYDNREGTIRVFGHDVHGAPMQALQQLGVVFQQRTLDLDLTVLQNLRYHGALRGMSRGEVKRRATHELTRSGLIERAAEKARRLSGGQVRRVEIARALLHEPRLLLLDEPTVGLDIESRQAILDHVRGLCRDQGLAALWATHLIDEVASDALVVILHQGRIMAHGERQEVVAACGARDVREAYTKLTRPAGDAPPSEAVA